VRTLAAVIVAASQHDARRAVVLANVARDRALAHAAAVEQRNAELRGENLRLEAELTRLRPARLAG
jgi:cell division protein FtsB